MNALPRFALALAFFIAGAANAAIPSPLSIDTAVSTAAARKPIVQLDVRVPREYPSAHFPDLPWSALPASSVVRVHVVVRYLDAVIADLQEAALSENIAMAYIRWERARAAKPNDAGTLVLDAVYRDLLLQRARARLAQREARSLLAIAMGNATDLPGELVEVVDPLVLATMLSAGKGEVSTTAATLPEIVVHARRVTTALREHAEGAELTAARARLAVAEARQDEQRESYSKGQSHGLELGDAMAAVAHAQIAVRIAQYRSAVYRQVELLGGDSSRTPQ